MTAVQLAAVLADLPPANVPAVKFYLELQQLGPPDSLNPDADPHGDVAWLLANREFIEAALSDLQQQLDATTEIGNRCQRLQPKAAQLPPAGI